MPASKINFKIWVTLQNFLQVYWFNETRRFSEDQSAKTSVLPPQRDGARPQSEEESNNVRIVRLNAIESQIRIDSPTQPEHVCKLTRICSLHAAILQNTEKQNSLKKHVCFR